MSKTSLICKEVTGQVLDFCADRPVKYRASEPLQLMQWWKDAAHVPAEGGVSYVGFSSDGLWFYVCLEDSSIYTQARNDNEKLWTLGDVAEFFVKPGETREDYWEIHVSPNGLIMDIHIPSRDKYINGVISWEDVVAADSRSTKQVQVIPAENRWTMELCIPWAAFEFESVPAPGTVWQFAVCRYNYSGDLESLELSATAHFTELNFHRYEEYTNLIFD